MNLLDVLWFFGELMGLVVGFSLLTSFYHRLTQILENLQCCVGYLRSIALAIDRYVREDERRRQDQEAKVLQAQPAKVIIDVDHITPRGDA